MIDIEVIRENKTRATYDCDCKNGFCKRHNAQAWLRSNAEEIAAFAISLDAECRRYKARVEELEHSCHTSLRFYREELEAIGGCDHSVGICCCGIIAEADKLARAIEGSPANTQDDEKED